MRSPCSKHEKEFQPRLVRTGGFAASVHRWQLAEPGESVEQWGNPLEMPGESISSRDFYGESMGNPWEIPDFENLK